MTHFDVVVLGAGPGGYVAAIRAAQLGLSTAIIEKKYWGGVCLNVGCIPTKSLLRNAELAHIVTKQAKTYGITGDITVDYGPAFTRSRQVSERMVKGIHFLMKKNKIVEFDGWGTFKDAKSLEVRKEDGSIESVEFDHCIIAVGSVTRMLPGMEKSDKVVTYEEQILSETLPKSIIVAGSGAIGSEFAYVMANYGTEVTIVEFLDRMLPNEDPEISAEVAKAYKKLGIKVMTGTKVESVDESGEGVKVTVSPAKGGDQQILEADKFLSAIGFAPRTEGYGLENTGVKLTDRGAIEIDDVMRTNVEGIYAIGDVTAKLMLAHTAEAQGVIAAEDIAGEKTMPIDYAFVPRATYCQPQVGSIGYTEPQLKDRGVEYTVGKFPFTANGKAHGLGEAVGFVKILADKQTNEILGAHMVGPDVTELLPELTLAVQWDLRAEEIGRTIHAHPTLSEAIKEAAEGTLGHMINF